FGTRSQCEFWAVAELPRTATGEIDRAKLIDAVRRGRRGDAAYVAPRTEAERRICGIWQDVLGSPPVGIHDNFFELGGPSLLAAKVIARLRDAFGVELPLRTLFEATSVARLAEHLGTVSRAGGEDAVPRLVPIARPRDLPPSFAQQRLWFFDQLEPGNPVYNIASLTGLRRPLAVPGPESTPNAMPPPPQALSGHPPA